MNLEARHLFDDDENDVYDKTVISLSVGAPGEELLKKCCNIMELATKHRMAIESQSEALMFQYASAVGNIGARTELAEFLSEGYGSTVKKHDLVLTSGASYGLHHILTSLIDMNGVIFVDDVTYMIALNVFKQFSYMRIVPVKLTKCGVDTDELESLLLKHNGTTDRTKMFWAMYYTIPTYHNPTSIVFSNSVCEKLVALARTFDILIVCDDVYNLLHFDSSKPPARLFAYDDFDNETSLGNVISNGSFAKLIAPGFRMGWMECPPRCVKAFYESGVLTSGGCPSNYSSGILQSLLELGLVKSHVEMMSKNYKSRMDTVCGVLNKKLIESCHFRYPSGGIFVWISLPDNIKSTDLKTYCIEKYKVSFIPGNEFTIGTSYSNCLRIAVSYHPEDILKEAAEKLCAAITEFCQQH